MSVAPYRSSPIFDEETLPAALRSEHTTKPGVWAVIRVLAGSVHYTELDPLSERILKPGQPGLIQPERRHFVTPLEPMRMCVEFYRTQPDA